MFQNVEPLSPEKHADLKIDSSGSYAFAEKLTLVPLSHAEIVTASRYYPIVFPAQDNSMPQALLSITIGSNSFVDGDGNWTVPYVPAHIRRYPFILNRVEDKGSHLICIDSDASHLSRETGTPIYDESGQPAEILKQATSFLQTYLREIQETETLFAMLHDTGLLKAKQFTIGRGDRQSVVKGFRAVDMDRLKALDNDTLGAWVKNGIMGLIYAHINSLANVRGLAGQAMD